MGHRKASFAARFTIVSLAIIMFITIATSLIFFINFRTISSAQIELTLSENVAHLRDTVRAQFNEWSALIRYTAFGISPFMAREPVDVQSIETLLKRVADVQPDLWLLYCSSNIPWSEPRGYMIYNDGHTPPETLDNTKRSWFINAKENPGQITYSEPFMAMSDKKLTISISTNVYDETGRDLGVISGNVSLDCLEEILQNNTFLPNQRLFILNKAGQFITKSDMETGNNDFFVTWNIEDYRDNILSAASFFEIDKKRFIYSVSIPNTDWILVSMIPTSVVFTKVNNFFVQMLCINFGLIAIAVCMALFLTRILNDERDENAAMKDNLKIGFFLMDRNYTIQGQYSHALEALFATTDLKGKNFIGLLASSIRDRDINTLKDYFEMIFNRSFDQDLLDDVNPIQELSYISVETGEEKILSCGFTAVNRGNNEIFILGNIMDITTEKKLQMKLKEETVKRQEEMHFLFEIIQGDPQILQDFIEDMDYEFNQIGNALNNERLGAKEVAVTLYQSIHAIKSNAVILGLKTFGDKLHVLESEIKSIREQEAVLEEDIQRIVDGVKQMKRERGSLIAIIHKIQSFRTDGKQNQGEHLLIESLNKVCTKISEDLDKQVQLVVRTIDPQTIEKGPRRLMKEVLVQLTRNAVYHGIENRDERLAKGKDETGVISLSITAEDGHIRIQLSDDGKGIDFAKIKAKAEQMQIVPLETVEEDRLLQIIFAPGFSTADEEGLHAGRGIGLNLVQDRIQEVQGTITVQSESQKGTVFTIIIPLIDEAITQAS